MGRRYKQLSLEDRCEIARLQAEGRSIRQIAADLDRPPSTISRELRRNRAVVDYRPIYAQQQAKARRWVGSRLERDPTLRRTVLDRLARGWSPEQVAGRLNREAGHQVISYESIYRFVCAPSPSMPSPSSVGTPSGAVKLPSPILRTPKRPSIFAGKQAGRVLINSPMSALVPIANAERTLNYVAEGSTASL